MTNEFMKNYEKFVFSEKYPQNIVGDFIIEKTIGEGTFGKVYLGTHIRTKEKVAVKILEKDKIKEGDSIERVNREISLLKNLKNENVIQLFEKFEDKNLIFLFMEYAEDGELFNYIVSKTKLKEKEASYFFVQIIQGIEYIHSNFICHRDLKPENILINENKILKIIDFGLSNSYKNNTLLETPCGSPCYAAPEMLLGNKYNGLLIDIWSIGIILYAMIHGFLPFEDENNVILYKKILESKLEFPYEISPSCKDIIKKLLCIFPEKRIKLNEIKAHPFYQMGEKFLKKREFVIDQKMISNKTIDKLVKIGYKFSEIKSTLKNNETNHISTAYYLLYNKVKSVAYSRNLRAKERIQNISSSEYKNDLCESDNDIENYDLNEEDDIKFLPENKKESQSNGNKESQSSLQIVKEMSKTQSNEMLNTKFEINLKNQNINQTYSKSSRTDDINMYDKKKKINNIVKLYTNKNMSDEKLEMFRSNKNISLFNKNKDYSNFKIKNNFSYNSLFNKNLSSKHHSNTNSNILNGSKDFKNGFSFKNEFSNIVPLSTLTNNVLMSKQNLTTNGVVSPHNNMITNIMNTNASNSKIKVKTVDDSSSKRINHNNLNMKPLENSNKIFTKIKIKSNIQELIKDFKHNIKHVKIESIFKKKNTLKNNLDDRSGEKNINLNEYKYDQPIESSSTINRFFKQTSASPISLIPLSTTHKIDQISKFNYSHSNLSSNYNSKRDSSKDKNKVDPPHLKQNNFIPQTSKSPIKLFSTNSKIDSLILTTKNKYSNLSNKIDSFFNNKEFNVSKKSNSPGRKMFVENKNNRHEIKSLDRVKPDVNYKNNKPNILKVYTKATSPNSETPSNINDSNRIINSTKNINKDYLSNDATLLKDRALLLKEKIFKFCKINNVDINEIDKNTVFECTNKNNRFKIELNSKNPSEKLFKVTHIKGKEESTKYFMMKLINNIEKE